PATAVGLRAPAGARVAMGQPATPAEVEDSRSHIAGLETELEIIGREHASGWDVTERETSVKAKLEAEKKRLAELEARWKTEKGLVDQILELRKQMREAKDGDGRPAALEKLKKLDAELTALQG